MTHDSHGVSSRTPPHELSACPCFGGAAQAECASTGCGYCAPAELEAEVQALLGDAGVFSTLVPDDALKEGETVDAALLRIFEPILARDETNELLLLSDRRYGAIADKVLADLIATGPKSNPKIVDRARGIFEVGGKRHHLRVSFLRRKAP